MSCHGGADILMSFPWLVFMARLSCTAYLMGLFPPGNLSQSEDKKKGKNAASQYRGPNPGAAKLTAEFEMRAFLWNGYPPSLASLCVG